MKFSIKIEHEKSQHCSDIFYSHGILPIIPAKDNMMPALVCYIKNLASKKKNN